MKNSFKYNANKWMVAKPKLLEYEMIMYQYNNGLAEVSVNKLKVIK